MLAGPRRPAEEGGEQGLAADDRRVGRGRPGHQPVLGIKGDGFFPARLVVEIGVVVDQARAFGLDQKALLRTHQS